MGGDAADEISVISTWVSINTCMQAINTLFANAQILEGMQAAGVTT